MTDLKPAIAEAAVTMNRLMDLLLPRAEGPEARLFAAMRYAALGDGKRLRPFIAMQSASLFGVDPRCAARVGAAIEFLHAYSLIHDDLPAMDDSDTRRGRPSCHREFDEATAILAGDALQSLAFEVLSEPETHADAMVRSELIGGLARAAGGHGMAGGQMIDLMAASSALDIGAITRLQRLKTGEIIVFAAMSGAMLGRAGRRQRQALHGYAQELGLAFQITDDLIDARGDTAAAGKPTGQDAAAGKATFVGVLGPARARAQARLLSEQAIRALDLFDDNADLLRELARFVVTRTR